MPQIASVPHCGLPGTHLTSSIGLYCNRFASARTCHVPTGALLLLQLTPHIFVTKSLASRFRPPNAGPTRVSNILQASFFVLVLFQVLADFASCFALGALIQQRDGGFGGDSTQDSPIALIVGYSFTAVGFAVFVGPVTVVSLFEYWRDPGAKGLADDQAAKMQRDRQVLLVGRDWSDDCADSLTHLSKAFPKLVNRRNCSAVGAVALFLGLLYVIIGGALLLTGVDIYCSSYTLSGDLCRGGDQVCEAGVCK